MLLSAPRAHWHTIPGFSELLYAGRPGRNISPRSRARFFPDLADFPDLSEPCLQICMAQTFVRCPIFLSEGRTCGAHAPPTHHAMAVHPRYGKPPSVEALLRAVEALLRGLEAGNPWSGRVSRVLLKLSFLFTFFFFRAMPSREVVFGEAKEFKILFSDRMRPVPVDRVLGKSFTSNVTFKKFKKSKKTWELVRLFHHPSKHKGCTKPYRVDLRCKCSYLAGERGILFHRLVHFVKHAKKITPETYEDFCESYALYDQHIDHSDGCWWKVNHQQLTIMGGSQNSKKR